MENKNLRKCFKDVSETTNLYFRYLHLGYFYDELSKRLNFSRIATNINVITGQKEGYILSGNMINSMLDEIYSRPKEQSFFVYLTIINSVRGICMAFFESFDNDQFKNILLNNIFSNDDQKFLNFQGVIRFIRNTLSHNIRDSILTNEEDYQRQKKWWERNGSPDRNKIHFEYDYSAENSAIHSADYKTKLNILINWNQIQNEKPYAEIIPTFQNFMLSEFCYNIIHHLNSKNIINI